MNELANMMNKICKNQMFFNFVVAFTVLQLYKIYIDNSLYCGVMFILTALIACQFTNNKACCLLAAIIVTNFVVGCSKLL